MNCSFATDMQRSLTGDQEWLYLLGWRVWGDPDGIRLECVDTFSGEKEDFGIHASSDRAWKVAALVVGKRNAIANTGKP